jgi:cellulose synthase/poly-beta-1,6-N-acetylglucosamine synthase-like glycosyltransferase
MAVRKENRIRKPHLGIVIPVRNEEHNLPPLIEGIVSAEGLSRYEFDITAIDDYSTDASFEVLERLATKHTQLRVFRKEGLIGKGGALLEGIRRTHAPIVVTLDADCSYDPVDIVSLVKEVESGADIAVGDRVHERGVHGFKKAVDRFFSFLFGKLFFGLDFDVHSGLKAYRRSLFDHIEVQPSKWSFDLEFMLKAVNGGFVVRNLPVSYKERRNGVENLNAFTAAVELLWMSIMLKFAWLEPILIKGPEEDDGEIGWKRARYKPFTTLHHDDSAIQVVTPAQILLAVALVFVLAVVFFYSWHIGLIFLITLLTTIYFADLLFNLFLIMNALVKSPEIRITPKQISSYKGEWPMYTVICPLYKEWQVIPQYVQAMQAMDYPKDRLQVILSLEEDDKKTQEEARKMKLPEYFEILVTPHHMPKTKPKACNYALKHATGEYIVIYDAEDIPETDQLKKAVVAFGNAGKEVVCLQSKLNFYNIHQNLLTRFFTMEYSLWFDLVLTGLHSVNALIPLGGTSNHFKKESLNLLQGWDPFNVTEDCDLGIRLFKYGFKTQVLDSTTWEEANSSFWGWFPQRTRWIKGYIQTYLVHMRRPHEFITDWNNPHILTFQLVVGGKVLSMWVNPLLWLMTITYFVFRPYVGPFIESLYLTPVFYLAVFSLVIGNFLYFYYYMIGAAKRDQWDLVKYAFLVPVYWLMMSVASWRALYQMFVKPHHWEKTTHGLHLGSNVRIVNST